MVSYFNITAEKGLTSKIFISLAEASRWSLSNCHSQNTHSLEC